MQKKLNIAIGTEAFPPTVDGISTVAKCYADIINEKLGTDIQVQKPFDFRRGLSCGMAV